jgi:hypothetical protein
MEMGRRIERIDPDGPFLERNDGASSAQCSEETAEKK